MDPILERALGTLAGTGALALLSLLATPVRHALFYRRSDHEFEYLADSGICTWDLQWPWLRLTIEVANVSNEKIDKITFRKDKERSSEKVFEPLVVSDAFRPLFDREVYVQLHSIVREERAGSSKVYRFKLTFRRRKRLII